jgi:putative transposase
LLATVDAYRARLRRHLQHFDLALLDYCLTSNHVHLLIDAQDRLEVSRFMRSVAGEFARAYNRRKQRTNAFWGDNFHATLVEAGPYLWRCLCYIELNMVRCGVVGHPREWEWVGYHEITGDRRRYRLLDLEQLCWRLGTADLQALGTNLDVGLEETIAKDQVARQACWTESLAVGSAAFVEKVKPLILSRRETEVSEVSNGVWVLRETPVPYGEKPDSKNGSNALF